MPLNEPSSADDNVPEVPHTHASTMKTRVEAAQILEYLQDTVGPDISADEFLTGGEFSQAFAFERAGEQFVIRVNKSDNGFKKDAFAAAHFASPSLPIPAIVSTGTLPDGHFTCITKRAAGTTFELFDAKQMEAIMPQFMETIDAVHSTPMPGTGFGYLNYEGNAPYTTWSQAVLSVEKDPYFKWDTLLQTSFMERDVYERLVASLKQSAPTMPDECALLHGDLDCNTLTDGKDITAVIDWEGMRYGDPLFEIAWIQMWQENVPIAEIYRKRKEASGKVIERFDDRMNCYTTAIGLACLGFYAKSNQRKKYDWLKERLKGMRIL